MINSKPNNSKYNQGNYIPKNKDKVIKLNEQGGVYFRSSWERKIMIWLDNSEHIVMWGAECIAIPYQMKHFKNGVPYIKEHVYYPDFFYKAKVEGSEMLKQVVVEVKPKAEYNDVMLLEQKKFTVNENLSLKKIRNLEYRIKMAQKNRDKWKMTIEWCNKKGYEFKIITEDNLKGMG